MTEHPHAIGPAGTRPWIALGPADAPVIVFVHATRFTRTQWYPQVRRLSDRYRCVAVDLPGHGRRADEPFSMEAAVAAVDEAIAAEAPSGAAIIVGLSLGGYVAIETAVEHPERVTGLVLAGCSAEGFGAHAWAFRAFGLLLELVPASASSFVSRTFFRVRYGRGIAGPIAEAGLWPVGGAQAVRAITGRRVLERLGRLWVPVLIVNGTLDVVFAPQGDHWAASCRDGRHATLAGATHLSNLDRPASFARLVAAFAGRVTRGA